MAAAEPQICIRDNAAVRDPGYAALLLQVASSSGTICYRGAQQASLARILSAHCSSVAADETTWEQDQTAGLIQSAHIVVSSRSLTVLQT